MENKHRLFKIISIVSFIILITLFIFGVLGVSIKGRFIERLLLLGFTLSYLLLVYTSFKYKKKKRILLIPFIPVLFSFLSPLLFFHYAFIVFSNAITNEEVYYKKDEFRIIKGHSPMTNQSYIIVKREGVLDYVKGTFHSPEIDLKKFEIELDNDSVYFRKGKIKYSAEINKLN